uniref:Immunoglobulin domain-containing protein n=1 Tax=Esox lucius TaxID=8010 RepID=A0A3P8YCS1_ESOLU
MLIYYFGVISLLLLVVYILEGGQVRFHCSFKWASSNNKYFCKKTCSGEDILVETDGSKNETQGRYSIEDYGNGHITVTIKDLKKSDSGTYWCGVERVGLDTYLSISALCGKNCQSSLEVVWLVAAESADKS